LLGLVPHILVLLGFDTPECRSFASLTSRRKLHEVIHSQVQVHRMPYHHEYHLASTLDKEKEDVISPVISVVTGNRTLILTRRVLIGICALVIAGIVIAMCVHQQILFHWFHNKNDSTSALENSLANDSLSFENTDDHVRKELLKGVSSLNVYEHSYVKTLSQEKAESILQVSLRLHI